MKKLTGLLVTVAVLCFMLSVSVFAIPMPEVQVLSFTISGAETYPDGSSPEEGECFALVWSGDGEFDGLNPDGTPIGKDDEVLYIGKIYKDSNVSFQIKDGFKTGGIFEIYILDSRVFENDKLQRVGKDERGKIIVCDYVKAANAELWVAGSQPVPTPVSAPNGTVITAPSTGTANIPQLKFTSIKLDGDYVVMTAEDIVPGVNYATVSGGKESGIITSTSETIVLIRPKEGNSAIISGLSKTVFSTGDLRIIIVIAASFAVSVSVLAYKRKKRVLFSDCGEK